VVGVGFYLNYVGCKVGEKIKAVILYAKFYLNYVGCKAEKRTKKKKTGYCFI